MVKNYDQLTHLGRLRRIRGLAQAALAQYGIKQARFHLVLEAGNVLFRVKTSDITGLACGRDLFVEDEYLLRIHEPGYQESGAIELELAWLAAMRREADLPVPEPIPTKDGRLLLSISVPGIPGVRNCSLLRWVKGHTVKNHIRPHHLHAQGRLMGRLHNFSVQWTPPAGLPKRRFDWEGLFQNDVGSGMRNADAWALLSPVHREAFSIVSERIREVMDAWGEGPDVFGLIHGDLAADANLFFWHGEPRAIDFDDSGYGYWVFDLAVAMDACRDEAKYLQFREALLEGYAEVRTLPEDQAKQLELFLAALQVYWNLWAVGGTNLYPHLLPEYEERIKRSTDFVVRYVQQ